MFGPTLSGRLKMPILFCRDGETPNLFPFSDFRLRAPIV
jgi:hypothetical protein